MTAKASMISTLKVVLLILCCLLAGKLIFAPETPAYARMSEPMADMNYQITCANSRGLTCVIFNAGTGEVIQAFRLPDEKIRTCGMQNNFQDCNRPLGWSR